MASIRTFFGQVETKKESIKIWTGGRVIHSDNQATIEALNFYVKDSELNLICECRRKLNEVDKNNKDSLVWFPGHSGIKGTEGANTLVRKGAQTALRTGPSLI